MCKYECFIFDLYNTIIDDDFSFAEREKYRINTIYTILEKSMYPIKFFKLVNTYNEMIDQMGEYHAITNKAFTPFYQVELLLNKLNINDIIVFKKIYDCYTEAILQIPPKLIQNAEKTFNYLKNKGYKIALISNTGRTPGDKLRILLKDLKVLNYFDGLFFSDEIGFLKPHPFIFNVCTEWLSVNKNNCIFIGDSKYTDYYGAIGAGLNAYIFRKNDDDLYKIALKLTEI